jgi:hypothetical protein
VHGHSCLIADGETSSGLEALQQCPSLA